MPGLSCELAPHPLVDQAGIGSLARPHEVGEDELGVLTLERLKELAEGGRAAGHAYAAVTREPEWEA